MRFSAPFALAWALFLLLVQAPALAANNPAVVLRDIHSAQLLLQASAASFHRYQGAEGDNKHLKTLNADLLLLKDALRAVFQDLADMGMNNEQAQLKGHWQEAARNLNTALSAIGGKGFAEGQVVNDYLLNHYKAAKDLRNAYAAVVKLTGVQINPLVQALRDQTLLMQELCTLYLEQSYATYAYTYRRELGDEEGLDQMATRFRKGLDKLQVPATGNLPALLADARSKWQFLEKSFVNYNENSVPYLVLKFAPTIIGNLQQMTAALDPA
ncbi:MAG TPA: hypothetical protein VM553_07445 [Dongiaceae bacterium]|nr:hypothetical protein [Dongiaceae bacterium]